MDDDDWDLNAVVRGCAAAVTTPTPSSSSSAAAANNPFPYFPSNFPSHADQNSLDFPVLMDDGSDPFQGLHEIYQEFCADDPPPTSAAAAAACIMPFPPPPLGLQPHQHTIMQNRPPVRFNMQIQENLQFNISPTISSPPPNFPAAIPQPVRPRRRKNQQVKIVRQMTQEELSADSWAWRKYGQKPIKGSPYPRNYYRCSTSKGCAARKQVERSPNDPEIFIVSYSGEHTHPRPTHRSSLAGSTRSKFVSPPPAARFGAGGSNAALSQKGSMAASSSSPAAGLSFSPATPTMEAEAAAQNDDVQMADEEDGGGGEDDDDDNILMIPSDLMNDDDDMFRGFQDSDDHSSGGGGNFFAGGLLSSPPWTPTGSAAPFNGGGRGRG